MRSQVAALFGTAVITLIPAVQFSGLIDPVSSLEGFGRVIGEILPDQPFPHDLARHLLQGARLRRPARLVRAAPDRHPGAASALGALFLKKQED